MPLDAPNYWWKRIVPPLEFGSLHAVLFQMALIPLTMARYTISVLLIAGGGGWSVVDRFVPLHRMLRMHIHLGCTLVTLVVFATVLRFGLFALLCHRGEQASCDTLTSPDVMYSGYGILTATLILAGTSHVRHQIPYEAFNVIHHLAFITICAIAVVRTLDMEPRQGRAERSQTFLWCAATMYVFENRCIEARLHARTAIRLFHALTAPTFVSLDSRAVSIAFATASR